MGVMGTIYRSHTNTPLSKLGLDYCKAKKLTKDLNIHYIQYATIIFKTRRKLGFHQVRLDTNTMQVGREGFH